MSIVHCSNGPGVLSDLWLQRKGYSGNAIYYSTPTYYQHQAMQHTLNIKERVLILGFLLSSYFIEDCVLVL